MALALAGLAVGWWGGAFADQFMQPRGVTYGIPPNVTPAERSLGVNVNPAKFNQPDMDRAARIGVRWLRVTVNPVERDTMPTVEWLDRAHADGFKVLAVLPFSPATLTDIRLAGRSPPAGIFFHDWRPLGNVARELAERYKGKIDAYQIGDEPNLAAKWGNKFPNAADYAGLLREAAIGIRSADSSVTVVSAALAPTGESGPLNINEPEFLRQMYRAGARGFFDALGAEPFGFWSGPEDRRVDAGTLNFSRLLLLREVMLANGDGGKAVWATAFGWSVQTPGESSPFGGDAAEKQTQRTVDAIRRARDEWHWLGLLTFARWAGDGAGDARAGFALVQLDGSPSLLLQTLDKAGNARIATVGRYAANDSSAVYPRTWRVAADGADVAQSDATPLKITFRGTRIDLTVRRGLYEGVLFVNVDGDPANALPRDEQGRSYVVLFDPLGQTAEVTLARGLVDSEHVVAITPKGGWGQWVIAGWTVSRERDDTYWKLAGAITGMLVAVLAASSFALARVRVAYHGLARIVTPIAHPVSRFAPPAIFAAGILLYLSPNTVISWLLIALLAFLILVRLDTGLALAAFAIPYYLQPKPLGVGSYAVVEIVVLLCALAFGCRQAVTWLRRQDERSREGSLPSRLSALDYVALLWLIAGFSGVLVAGSFGAASREFRVVFAEPAVYYFLIRATRAEPMPLVKAFLAGAVAISLKAVGDWATGVDLITAEGVMRVRSIYFSPNNLALYLDRAIPVALSLALFNRSNRVLYVAASAPMLAALYLTFARGALVLALPAALLFMGAMRGRKVFIGALAALAVLGASLLPVLGTARLRSLFDLTAGTGLIRMQLWQSAVGMILDHPIWGVGLDNFLYQYRTRYILPTAFAEAGLSHPHNILLDCWTRLGLLGVILLVALLVVFWREAMRAYRRGSSALTLGLMASMAASLAHGLIDNSFFLVDLAFVLMLTLALVKPSGET